MARRLDNLGNLNLRHLGEIYELGNPSYCKFFQFPLQDSTINSWKIDFVAG